MTADWDNPDIPRDLSAMRYPSAYRRGRAEERTAITEWLDDMADLPTFTPTQQAFLMTLADNVRAGKHLPE